MLILNSGQNNLKIIYLEHMSNANFHSKLPFIFHIKKKLCWLFLFCSLLRFKYWTDFQIKFSQIILIFQCAGQILEMRDLGKTFQSLGWYFMTVLVGIFIHGLIVLPLIYSKNLSHTHDRVSQGKPSVRMAFLQMRWASYNFKMSFKTYWLLRSTYDKL